MAAITRSRTAAVVASFAGALVATRDRQERYVPGTKPQVGSSPSLRRLELGKKLPLHDLPMEFKGARALVVNFGGPTSVCLRRLSPLSVDRQ